MTDVAALTSDYERWLGQRIPLVGADLALKHEALAGPPVRFLRGTYYLWLAQMGSALPELMSRPLVALVGDLHVENFGTWRDEDGVRRWGVNDLDELAWGPYPIDLVRLATSALLVPDLELSADRICDTLLDHWLAGPAGPAVDLSSDAARHLRPLVPEERSDATFFGQLQHHPAPDVPPHVQAAARATGPAAWQPQWFTRQAGTGSLGHRRYAGVGPDAHGTLHAREAKDLGPLTRDWPGAGRLPGHADAALYPRVQAALRGPAPGSRVDGWQLRRLAPDVVRIDIAGLARHDEERVLRSMAQACADVHGTDAASLQAARADAAGRPEHWLHDAAREMAELTRAAHKAWRGAAADPSTTPSDASGCRPR